MACPVSTTISTAIFTTILRPFYDHVHSLYPSFGGDRGGQIRNPKSKSPPFFFYFKNKEKNKKTESKT